MPRQDPDAVDERLEFRRFRTAVIQFLRLPIEVDETALCDAMRAASPNLLAGYEFRAARARSVPAAPVVVDSAAAPGPAAAPEPATASGQGGN